MSELDEWREKQRKNVISDPEEALRIIMSHVDKDAPLYRLELLYDQENNRIILQGNQAGLDKLLSSVARLAHSAIPVGAHEDFNYIAGLSKRDFDLTIRKVGDEEDI